MPRRSQSFKFILVDTTDISLCKKECSEQVWNVVDHNLDPLEQINLKIEIGLQT